MSDELTPEETEALKNLPRERMPVGLEGRVVDAMREHGFLAKRRRAIVLTNTRAAGVLAAGVALLIGAYSIGLHRGNVDEAFHAAAPMGQQAPGTVAPAENDELGRVQQAPAVDAAKPESERLESKVARESGSLEKVRSRANDAPAASAEGKSGTVPPPRRLGRVEEGPRLAAQAEGRGTGGRPENRRSAARDFGANNQPRDGAASAGAPTEFAFGCGAAPAHLCLEREDCDTRRAPQRPRRRGRTGQSAPRLHLRRHHSHPGDRLGPSPKSFVFDQTKSRRAATHGVTVPRVAAFRR